MNLAKARSLVGKCLGIDTRIINAMHNRESTVNDLSEKLKVADFNIKSRLDSLVEKGLVQPLGKRYSGIVGQPSNVFGLTADGASVAVFLRDFLAK